MADWQPIETAPKNPEGKKDGPWVLIYCKWDHGIRQARWTVIVNGLTASMGWKTRDGHEAARTSPTHWMPLPEAPGHD